MLSLSLCDVVPCDQSGKATDIHKCPNMLDKGLCSRLYKGSIEVSCLRLQYVAYGLQSQEPEDAMVLTQQQIERSSNIQV